MTVTAAFGLAAASHVLKKLASGGPTGERGDARRKQDR
jgi:hypothetical protein